MTYNFFFLFSNDGILVILFIYYISIPCNLDIVIGLLVKYDKNKMLSIIYTCSPPGPTYTAQPIMQSNKPLQKQKPKFIQNNPTYI